MVCSALTDLVFVSVFSLARSTTSFFHIPLERSSIYVLASFISSLSAMSLSAQFKERERERERDCTHFDNFVCSSYRDSNEMKKGFLAPPSGLVFLKALYGKFFVRMKISVIFLCHFTKICFRTSSNHMWLASRKTHRMFSMLSSDVLGNSFRNGLLNSILLPVFGSQVSGRKFVVTHTVGGTRLYQITAH